MTTYSINTNTCNAEELTIETGSEILSILKFRIPDPDDDWALTMWTTQHHRFRLRYEEVDEWNALLVLEELRQDVLSRSEEAFWHELARAEVRV